MLALQHSGVVHDSELVDVDEGGQSFVVADVLPGVAQGGLVNVCGLDVVLQVLGELRSLQVDGFLDLRNGLSQKSSVHILIRQVADDVLKRKKGQL